MVFLIPVLAFLAFLVFCALMTTGQPLNPTRPLMSYDQAREYAYRLQKMICCKTISHKETYDDTEFAKLRMVMEELFPMVHKHCHRETFGDDCWVYVLPGQKQDHNIMLMSHHDVVAAEGDWQHPPFSGEIAEGKIWGRGTVDTKTSLFAIFSALEELLAEGFVPECNLWIASSHNEEVAGDGIPQVAQYFKEQGITFDFVLDEGGAVIDPPLSGMNCPKCAMVAIHEKGRCKLVLTAQEGSAHAGLTAGAKATPTERMAEFIAAFRKEDIFIRRMTPELEGMLKAMAPYMSYPMKIVFVNLWLFKPLLVKLMPKLSPAAAGLLGTTCAFNDLITEEGGKRCTARIMLRCIDDKDLEQDLKALYALADKYGIIVTEGEREYHAPADPSLPPYGQISQCIREVFPDVPVIPFILPAGTDARTLTDVCKCVLRFAPIRMSAQQLASVHSENENIDISAVGTAVVFYRRVLERYTSETVREEDEEEMEEEEIVEEQLPVPVVPEPEEIVSEAFFQELPDYPLEETDDALLDMLLEPEAEPELSFEDISDDDFNMLSDWEETV